MDSSQAIDMVRQALWLTLMLSAPILLTGLTVGLIVSVFQAMTQLQDQTLSLVPKIIAMLLATIITGSWIIQKLVEYSRHMFAG